MRVGMEGHVTRASKVAATATSATPAKITNPVTTMMIDD